VACDDNPTQPFLEIQLFRNQNPNSLRYFEKNGLTIINLEKENQTEWWQYLSFQSPSYDPNAPINGGDSIVEEILNATLGLQSAAIEWILQFPTLGTFAKTRSLYKLVEDCPISIEAEVNFIQSGILILRLLIAVKYLISHSGNLKHSLVLQNYADRSTKDMRELLALVPLESLPQPLKDAFSSVNITPLESLVQPVDFSLPEEAPIVSDLNSTSVFNNPHEKWIIEKKDEISRLAMEGDDPTSSLHFETGLNAMDVSMNVNQPNQLDSEPRIDFELSLDSTFSDPKDEQSFTSSPGKSSRKPRNVPLSKTQQQKLAKKKMEMNLRQHEEASASEFKMADSKLELKPTYDTDGASLVTSMQGQSISTKVIRQQLENTNLSDLYNAERIMRRNAESTKIQDVVHHRPKTQGHWTYQKLTECRSLQKMMSIVSGKLRSLLVHIHENSIVPVRFQILCLVDDSNSMAVFEHQMKETMVLLIEVLRHIECPFAIGRFAGKKVVDLLKDFQTSFDMNLGELILERLSCTGKGTCPADAFKSFLEKLWPTQDNSLPTHRIVIMVTDGLTTQVNANVYSELCSQYRVTLNTMVLWDASRPRNISRDEILLHNSLSAARDHNVEVKIVEIYTRGANKDTDALSYVFAGILENLFTNLRNQSQLTDGASLSHFSYRLANGFPLVMTNPILDLDILHQKLDLDLAALIHQSASTTMTSYYNVSSPGKIIPGASSLSDDPVDNDGNSRFSALENTKAEFASILDSLHPSTLEYVNRADLIWATAETQLSSEITRLAQVLEDCVFPFNKYTRRKGDLRGSTLYIPGLIKAIATDFTYKKYFGALSAGGKRRYSVVIAVDCSLSMQSFTAECVLQSLFLFISALKRVGVEFSVITFGEKVRLLKDSQSEWTPTHSWILLSQLTFEDYSSLDADAINCGVDLLMTGKGPKTLFLLSDGYGTSGKRLPAALRRAHMESVEVIALAIGMDKFGVSHSYQSWVECALPRYIPDALEALFRAEETPTPSSNDGKKWQELYISSGNNLTIQQIMAEHVPAFSEELNSDRNAELRVDESGSTQDLSVDLCFVTDLTGSMAPYAPVAIEQICQIINGIQGAAKKEYPELEVSLRVSFVGFRDTENSKYTESTLLFTSDKGAATAYIQNHLSRVSGGGDLAEDVCGGLAAALELDWKSSSKALILITDAPGHGTELNNGLVEDSKPNAPGPKSQIDKMIEKDINFFFCRINKAATSRMETTFSRLYNSDVDERKMVIAPLIIERNPPIAPPEVVYILCLDESGSMSGTPFAQLQSAYTAFLNRLRNDQGANKRIAIINFASTARWVCGPAPVPINSAPSTLPFQSGGTDFLPPMQFAGQVLAHPSCAQSLFVLLFMTDGCGGGPGTLVQDYATRYGSRFIMHSVGFGSGADTAMLNTLTAGGGRYHAALTGQELVNAFSNIAADSNTANQLPRTIVNQIMDTAVTKLVLDYL
jgi:uncharacterized protein YegL